MQRAGAGSYRARESPRNQPRRSISIGCGESPRRRTWKYWFAILRRRARPTARCTRRGRRAQPRQHKSRAASEMRASRWDRANVEDRERARRAPRRASPPCDRAIRRCTRHLRAGMRARATRAAVPAARARRPGLGGRLGRRDVVTDGVAAALVLAQGRAGGRAAAVVDVLAVQHEVLGGPGHAERVRVARLLELGGVQPPHRSSPRRAAPELSHRPRVMGKKITCPQCDAKVRKKILSMHLARSCPVASNRRAPATTRTKRAQAATPQ